MEPGKLHLLGQQCHLGLSVEALVKEQLCLASVSSDVFWLAGVVWGWPLAVRLQELPSLVPVFRRAQVLA